MSIMTAPVSYNQTSTDTFSGTVENSAGSSFDRFGVVENEADGYGTIILPNGNEYNALRHKIVKNTIDSTEVNSITQVVKTRTITHSYYIEEQKGPAFKIDQIIDSTFTDGMLMNANTTKYVRMPDIKSDGFDNEPDDPATGLFTSLKNKSNEISIYPNPVNGGKTLTVEFENDKSGTVQLRRVNGASVQKQKFVNSSTISFETEGLVSGLYLIEVKTNGNYSTKKVLVK